jgi:hypothetical protein
VALLSDSDRAAIWAEFMRDADSPFGALTKADLRAAFNAADAWADTNSASFNTALPQPARGVLTAKQKAKLLMYVIARRFLATA